MRPGLGRGLVHVAGVSHIVLARVGLRTSPELLAVLELLVFDLNDFCCELACAELLEDNIRQQALGFLAIGFIELIARFEFGKRRGGEDGEAHDG